MRVAIATDHNGVEQKSDIIFFLNSKNIEVLDLSKDNNPTDDYPDFALRVAKAVANKEVDLGILMCGTGIGMSIAANKVKGIRCAKVSSEEEAFLARQHNDANIIALSYKASLEDLKIMVDKFVTTDFSFDERHIRRIGKIGEIENNEL